MAFKQFQLDDLGVITVYKRKTSRNIRLTVAGNGEVKVTIPAWAPYNAGLAFARDRRSWIVEHQPTQPELLKEGQPVGKAHRLHFLPDSTIRTATSRLLGSQITVSYPADETPAQDQVQHVAREACVRALRSEAKKLLHIRLDELTAKYGYSYNSLAIKRLKGRWGSCDQSQNIVLNLFLMQLPWELIDYVILHELAHTKVLQHGPKFWAEMDLHLPRAKHLRKQIHAHQPVLIS
jgi:predicted metal-dependent hydrolase